jgi:hypothetical protein
MTVSVKINAQLVNMLIQLLEYVHHVLTEIANNATQQVQQHARFAMITSLSTLLITCVTILALPDSGLISQQKLAMLVSTIVSFVQTEMFAKLATAIMDGSLIKTSNALIIVNLITLKSTDNVLNVQTLIAPNAQPLI